MMSRVPITLCLPRFSSPPGTGSRKKARDTRHAAFGIACIYAVSKTLHALYANSAISLLYTQVTLIKAVVTATRAQYCRAASATFTGAGYLYLRRNFNTWPDDALR